MENFVVSARKYRPASFDTVVGQGSITSTLKNAIRNKKVAQAYLFCGPRGVGKTTCARILAKTINCSNITDNAEACNKCDSCRSFNEGTSYNILELDAASNNSVDDIRNLISQVGFAPQIGNYKIYIIDEVHMLSQAAFNAFLKTLEEPPKHAIFILATTEKHKIIPTILSRCQIFDFHRIQIDDIARQLGSIAKKEGITAEADALHVIAQKADGAMRDALSIFDQIVSFAGKNVTYKAVIENLNVLDHDYYFKVTDCMLGADIPMAMLLFNEILNNGFDGHHFIAGLAEHFRNLLVCKDASTLQLLEVGEPIKARYKDQSQKCPQQLLLRALNLTTKADTNYKTAKNQRLLVEFMLMQLCSLAAAPAEEKKSPEIIAGPKNFVSEPKTVSKVSEPNEEIKQPKAEEPVKKADVMQSMTGQKEGTVISGNGKKISFGTSIRHLMEGENTEEKKTTAKTEAVQVEKLKNSFTQERLEDAWNKYSLLMRKKGKLNFAATLTNRKPVLKENAGIGFMIDNLAQEEEFAAEKTDLVSFLKNELQNTGIVLQTSVSKNPTEKRPYSPQEKFKYLSEKNPALLKLKQQLDMEIE